MKDMDNRSSAQAEPSVSSGLFIALGWTSAILSLFIYPFIFGVVGVVMGILAEKGGRRGGLPLIVGSIILMAVGLILSPVILNYTRHYLGF